MSYKLILRFKIIKNIVYTPCDNYFANANIWICQKALEIDHHETTTTQTLSNF